MKKVKFTKDFSTKKKGDSGEYDPWLANRLVKDLKVAKYDKDVKDEQPD